MKSDKLFNIQHTYTVYHYERNDEVTESNHRDFYGIIAPCQNIAMSLVKEIYSCSSHRDESIVCIGHHDIHHIVNITTAGD